MEKWAVFATVASAVLPVIAVLVILWSDVQTMKETKVDYREVAELKVEMIGTLSKNTEAIEGLNKILDQFLNERSKYGKEASGN